MGCDIHSIVEVKNNEVWERNTTKVFPDLDWNGVDKGEKLSQWPDNRHYDWFALLADVRNGYGFGGVATGGGFVPIDNPRGLPEDPTAEWTEKLKEWGDDMHSVSYMHLSDFDEYDWNRETFKTGAIPLDQYKTLKGTNNSPEQWSGSISGGGIITLSEEEADILLEKGYVDVEEKDWFNRPQDTVIKITETSHKVYVQYVWKIKCSEWFKHSIEHLVDPLRILQEKYEDVRVVFGFDN